ncbi:MAG TPA: 16S rRNA (adenine(1518)-N(6)/adenine(1519)-N(6))-dimethyltransferase RsmA [Anaerolineales bacterium]|nr:16S rRNA (adenine(1518)-N(6)/adenine(1519)-N(6))-dimethyltransferase RsmA [Anaerolineales bacterium]HMV95304.1 16S rRNA (adenine(1518)-N(6)/adenine(1519)-N(6))-dimethyltransferase RsmA [Anaerolineales bacterium]HMX18272.1 16S rRNA (adenine(1518)-N(6)/adenine(1519)-N(6))-dimethyltransferase RsmA [Anaerolineales bacterium]HMX74511.1 16S rRNA (adenine(1518)-N(6)/adenine(1519)-N(6))-dimethyltransferase RsmA [Anaerolineales bacterium]HMZ41770.1 16S rRNA (adenine(1518)-N(6)/adenine(1519)-N(6))-dim
MTDYRSIPPLDAHAVLKRFQLRADKSLGQNFLQDSSALEKIARAAEIQGDDCVLEIGPGLGSLTRYLAASAQKVTAVELDPDLLAPLRAVLSPYQNVNVIHGDILKLNISEIIEQPDYLVAANIPYNITSAIIRHLLESTPKPRRVVLTIQKEVAERICAAPGDLSLLALSVQVYGRPSIAAKIPAGAFHPVPKVDSAILRIDIHKEPLIPAELLNTFFKLIKAGFSQKRKTLRNSLSSGLHIPPHEAESMLTAAGIDFMRRAETLSIEEWRRLCG